MAKLFTNQNTWFGGYYELAIEVGPTSDTHLLAALTAIWRHPLLEGCYLDSQKEPDEQPNVQPTSELLSKMRLHGVAQLPNGRRVACGTILIREDGGSDWLVFYLPLGALGEAYDIGEYPFDQPERSHDFWQKPLDEWLLELSKYIYKLSPFRLALIGFEVSGDAYSDQIQEDGIPLKRYFGYVWPQGDQVQYFPKNLARTDLIIS